MNDLLVSFLVFALILGGAVVGMAFRPLLSEHHLHSDSRDVVKLTASLVGTLTALVLGLLIASAKSTFDQKTSQVRQLTATNDAQRSLQSRATQAFTDGAQIRLQLFARTGGSIPVPFLIIVVFWLGAIFASVTLYARANLVVMASLCVCALSLLARFFRFWSWIIRSRV